MRRCSPATDFPGFRIYRSCEIASARSPIWSQSTCGAASPQSAPYLADRADYGLHLTFYEPAIGLLRLGHSGSFASGCSSPPHGQEMQTASPASSLAVLMNLHQAKRCTSLRGKRLVQIVGLSPTRTRHRSISVRVRCRCSRSRRRDPLLAAKVPLGRLD